MRILIFGGTGYIGTQLLRFFIDERHIVGNISRKNSQIPGVINFSSKENLTTVIDIFKPDKVIYLSACFDNENVNEIVEVNINIPLKILKILEEYQGIEFIYTGTYWQFGNGCIPGTPIDLYSASKKAMSAFLRFYAEYREISCKEIVLYGTYGDSDGRGKLLDYLINSAISKQTIELTEGYQKLNLVCIKDLCIAIRSILLTTEGSQFTIQSSTEYTPRGIVELIQQYAELDVNFGIKPYRKVELMTPNYPEGYIDIIIPDSLPDYICKRFS
jgi:nucleoside-diphosphate-sugar epimerase